MEETIDKTEENLAEWKVHLLKRDSIYRSLISALAVLSCMVLAFIIMSEPLVVAVYAFVFILALAEYFFPVTYRLTEKGAYSRGLLGERFLGWDRVKKCYKNGQGIKLSVFNQPSALESFRGLFLRFGDNEDELVPLVRRLSARDS